MAGLQAQGQNPSGAGANAADGMTGFYNQVCSRQIIFRKIYLILLPKISNIQDELRRFDGNVSRIADLHSRSLNNTDEALAQQNAAALDELLVETRSLSNQIKAQIQQLEKEPVPQGQDARIRRNQASETPSKLVCAFALLHNCRPPSSVRNSSRLCRTISRSSSRIARDTVSVSSDSSKSVRCLYFVMATSGYHLRPTSCR